MNCGNTTQTDGCTSTKVTRVGNDIKTCDTSLKGFINRCDTDTFKLFHVDGLRCCGNLIHRDGKTCALAFSYSRDSDFLDSRIALEDNLSESPLIDGQFDGLTTNVRNTDFILRILYCKREVTVDIGSSMSDNTIVVVNFHHVTHHQRVEIIPYLTADNVARFHLRTCLNAEAR